MANTKVTSRVLANDAVLTANIADDQVTTAKIADDVALGGNPTTTTQSAGNNTTRIATTAFVTTAVANIVDSAPSALDTLNELAAALGDDANFSTTITNSIAGKVALSGSGQTIADSGNLTLDVAGNILLDADGGTFSFEDAATGFFAILNSSNDAVLRSGVHDKDLIFKGYDGSSEITALTLDMSDAGSAFFNADVYVDRYFRLRTTDDQANQWLLYTNTNDNLEINYNGSGNAEVVVDTSGNVGIGTTSPEGKFEIEDGGTGKSILQKITLDNDDVYGLVVGNDSYSTTLADGLAVTVSNAGVVGLQARGTGSELAFRTVGTERARIDASGNIQIVGGNQMTQGLFFYNGANGHLLSGIRNKSNSSYNDSGGIEFLTSGTSNAAESVKMALDTQGNLGIGTTSPDGPLHVKGSGDTYVYLEAGSSDGNVGHIFHDNGGSQNGYTIYDTDDDIYYINVNGINRFKVQSGSHFELRGPDANSNQVKMMDSSGNIDGYLYAEAGEIGFLDADGNWAFQVNTDTSLQGKINNSEAFLFKQANSSHNNHEIMSIGGIAPRNDITLTQQAHGENWASGGHTTNGYFYVVNSGNAGVYIVGGQSSWTANSDERIKENITSLGSVLPEIKDIRCVKFNLKGESETRVGFIAQDWESKSFKEVLNENDGFVIEEDGSVKPAADSDSTDKVKGIAYTETVPVLLKAIQELQEQIETLKKEVEELKGG